MNEMLCRVSGLQNKAQKTQIKNSLNKIEGIGEVGVDLAKGTINIKYNAPSTETDIKDCLENTGFKIIYE